MYDYTAAEDLNQKNSTVKSIVDGWYAKNLIDYSDFIDDEEIYCNNRIISDFKKWNSDNPLSYGSAAFYVENSNYTCERKIDAFSKKGTYGNGDLKYPIGLMTSLEAMKLSSYKALITPTAYYLMSLKNTGGMNFVSTNGSISNSATSSYYGIRPVIALKERLDPEKGEDEGKLIEYIQGDGSTTNPYVVVTDIE